MAGQAVVSIRDRQWLVELAVTYAELAEGLGGLPEMPTGTGMLFDTGAEQIVTVTTAPMLFPIDIVFVGGALLVTEVTANVAPGFLVTSGLPARFFLEVNASEAAMVQAGDPVAVQVLQAAAVQDSTANLIPQVVNAMAAIMVLSFMAGSVRSMAKSVLIPPSARSLLYGPRGERLLPRTTKRPTRDDVRVEVWEERDRLHIGLQDRASGDYVASWWDDEARDMFEQGFFKRGRGLPESVLAYAEEVGLLAPQGPRRYSHHTALVPSQPSQPPNVRRPGQRTGGSEALELLADSPGHCCAGVDGTGLRPQLERAFAEAIARAKRGA